MLDKCTTTSSKRALIQRTERTALCSVQVIHATPSSCLVEEGSELVKGLLTQLVTMLRDKESYVYLAAVHGLAVLRYALKRL